MARNYIYRSKGQELGIEADVGITGAVTHDSTLTQTGAATFASTVTSAQLPTVTPGTIAGAGTLSTSGVYVFDGANAAIHLPAVASSNGVTYTIANINGTGTATLTSDATDGAFILVAANGTNTLIATPYTGITVTGYAAGTCWIGVN